MPDRILVVDDEPDILNVAKMILEGGGYQVITAPNGDGALRRADEGKPDLIILDIVMPDKSGLEVCKNLKAEAFTRFIPVVMFSVLSRDVDKGLAQGAGADGYLIKPFSPESLLREVEKYLEQTRGDKFSTQLGIQHKMLLGKKILLEFDPSTPYERLIRDFAVECVSHGEKVVALTKKGGIILPALEGEEGVTLMKMTANMIPNDILESIPERPVGLIFDNLTDLALARDLKYAYIFSENSLDLLSDSAITAIFLLNPFAHEQKDVSSLRGLFSDQVVFGKQGITSVRLR